MPIAAMIAVGVAALAMTAYVAIARERRYARERVEAARAEAKLALRSADIEAAAIRRGAETRAREEALALRHRIDREIGASLEELAQRDERIAQREQEAAEESRTVEEQREAMRERQQSINSLKDRARGLFKDAERRQDQALELLERASGKTRGEVRERLSRTWLEEARAEAAQTVRSIEQNADNQDLGRHAARLMDIATSRYKNHFLTERNISNIPVPGQVVELLLAEDSRILAALQEIANVQLNVSDSGDSIRLEGLDGVGREIARRALSRLSKKPNAAGKAQRDPAAWATKIREQLDREILGLGRKAFSVLKIPRPHPEIVTLVGRLNYRTSYTQNQWLHAVEASFLGGMIAAEMGLDVKLTRRAALMHDIGKALTHEIEGSHAVIGADIARRLGEDELIANAIGAHHADEPANSVYAYLVAGADAMSGARPGARREHSDGYSTRLEDLERIGSSYDGVERCYAVHGGRELRVYVREGHVSDLDAVELSSEIAEQISEEMTFPGQIKVTVIRATEAVSVAS